jgi:lysozyme
MTSPTGIDVSAYQGEFNWGAHPGIAFAGIRATSWTGAATFARDADLDHNARHTWDTYGGKAVRIYYHETRPAAGRPDDQAAQFLRLVGGHLCRGDMLAAAMEDAQGLPGGQVAAWHGAFLHHLRVLTERAHRVLAYCNPSWCEAGNADGLGGWPLWLADYGVTNPAAPKPWRHWTFHQYNGTGLDEDVYCDDLSHLQDWAGLPAYRR